VCPKDPDVFDYVSIEGHRLDCPKGDLVDHLPASIVKGKQYALIRVI